MKVLKTEIIATGSELLWGGLCETNSVFLADRFVELGFELIHKSVVGDDEPMMAEVIQQAASRARVVLITGGLGPTEDDLTKKVISRVTGRRLILQERLLDALRERFAKRQLKMPAKIDRQALMPSRAVVVPNPMGTAPGFILHWGECYLISLPGVPAEMRSMFEATVVPFLTQRFPTRPYNEIHRYRTYGLMESKVNERLVDLMIGHPQVRIGLTAGEAGVDVRVLGTGRNRRELRTLLADLLPVMEERLTDILYTRRSEGMESVVGRLLKEQGKRLALAESCTGGLIGHRLTSIPGSSSYLDRVVVCYSDRAKTELLDISPEMIRANGAVSEAVAGAMAMAVRRNSRVDLGVSVTGIAGPGGATPQKPVGTVFFGLDDGGETQTCLSHFSGDREMIKFRASQYALDWIRRSLLKKGK